MTEASEIKKCPYCKEEIHANAIKCKHCHSDLTSSPDNAQASNHPVPSPIPNNATEIRYFDATTRIGRLRYLAYPIGADLLALIPMVIGTVLLGTGLVWLGTTVSIISYIFLVVMGILFTIRRLHDMNASGWWTLLMLVPLGNIIFILVLLFTPGTIGENRYGKQPPQNSGWVIAGVVCYFSIVPIAFIGMLAAIAIPQYQDYVVRSKITEGLNLAAAPKTAVEETYKELGYLPATGNDMGENSYGLPVAASISGAYVSSIAVAGKTGVITITYNPDTVGAGMTTSNNTLTLTPIVTNAGINWLCGNNSDQTGNITGIGTTVPNKYLLPNCRD
ncbi:MAG: DUF805 domain-containing protein [Gammaproteobacteria bacterium]